MTFMDKLAVKLGQMLHIFKVLDRRPNPRNWTPEQLRIYTREQDECWAYAQALGALAFPALQQELEKTRRQVMEVIGAVRALQHGSPFGSVIAPGKKISYQARWTDHQVSPEFTRDPTLTGIIIPRGISQKLVKLHRQQVSAITGLVRATR